MSLIHNEVWALWLCDQERIGHNNKADTRRHCPHWPGAIRTIKAIRTISQFRLSAQSCGKTTGRNSYHNMSVMMWMHPEVSACGVVCHVSLDVYCVCVCVCLCSVCSCVCMHTNITSLCVCVCLGLKVSYEGREREQALGLLERAEFPGFSLREADNLLRRHGRVFPMS